MLYQMGPIIFFFSTFKNVQKRSNAITSFIIYGLNRRLTIALRTFVSISLFKNV